MDPRQKGFGRMFANLAAAVLIGALAAGCAAPTAAPTSAPAPAAKHKVAYFTAAISTVGSYEITHSTAFNAMCEKYDFECTIVEQLPNSKAPETARSLAAQGYEVIVTLDNGYETSFGDAASELPEVMFVVMQFISSNRDLPNYAAFAMQVQPAYFYAGYAAGLSSKTGVVAVITGEPIIVINGMYAGIKHGVEYANPNGEVMRIYTNSWVDNSKSKEATLAAIADGADVIMPFLGSADEGSLQAAKEKGVVWIGHYSDQYERAPGTVLTSVVYNVPLAYDTLGDLISKGELKGQIYPAGLAEGYISLSPNGTITQEVLDKAEQVKQALISGEIKVDLTEFLAP